MGRLRTDFEIARTVIDGRQTKLTVGDRRIGVPLFTGGYRDAKAGTL